MEEASIEIGQISDENILDDTNLSSGEGAQVGWLGWERGVHRPLSWNLLFMMQASNSMTQISEFVTQASDFVAQISDFVRQDFDWRASNVVLYIVIHFTVVDFNIFYLWSFLLCAEEKYNVQKRKNLKTWITELVHRSKNRNCLGKFIHRYNLLEKVKCLTSIVTDRHVAVNLERHPFNCPSSKHQYSKYGSILAVKVILLFKDGQER